MTKEDCKYCGSLYIHKNITSARTRESKCGGPIAIVYNNKKIFKPILHDTRQPIICDDCGADVLIGYSKLKYLLGMHFKINKEKSI